MINSKDIFNQFIHQLTIGESSDELASIGFLVFESVFGMSRSDIIGNRAIETSPYVEMRLQEIADRINSHEPIQYILGKADFYGRQFKVDPAVLIPRPETEELVHLIVNKLGRTTTKKIIDIGTGSGCIAITISLELKNAIVTGTDVSEQALKTARQNNHILEGRASFVRHDILNEPFLFDDVDVIVSNPPYIAPEEIHFMQNNVKDFEPHLALFTPDRDPLVFYKAIAVAAAKLNTGGLVATEINERFGSAVQHIFADAGLASVEILKDISCKERIVIASRV